MKQLTATVLATAILFPGIVTAQLKTRPGDALTVTATGEAIERSSRSLTVEGLEGRFLTITVPADVKRFDAINVGDTLTARYYEIIVLRV